MRREVVFEGGVPRVRALTESAGGEEFLPLFVEGLVGAGEMEQARTAIRTLAERGYQEPFLSRKLPEAGLAYD